MGQPEQLPVLPSSPYLLVAGLRKLPEHLIQLGLLLLQVPILLAQLLLQHRGPGNQQGRREAQSCPMAGKILSSARTRWLT